jgi:hypothetical protein
MSSKKLTYAVYTLFSQLLGHYYNSSSSGRNYKRLFFVNDGNTVNRTESTYPKLNKRIRNASMRFRRWHQKLHAQETIIIYPERGLCRMLQGTQRPGYVDESVTRIAYV